MFVVVRCERMLGRDGERGYVLLVVLTLFFAVYLSAASFVWFMTRLQTYAGAHYRSLAALGAAEGGLQYVLAALESSSPDDGSGRSWRPHNLVKAVQTGALTGHFTVSVDTNGDGSLKVTSEGTVAGRVRRLEARVTLASPALLAALYGTSVVQFERPTSRVTIVQYDPALASERWAHVAAGEAIRFVDVAASIINGSVNTQPPKGPIRGLNGAVGACSAQDAQPARLVLPRDAFLTVGRGLEAVGSQQLRAEGYRIEEHWTPGQRFPSLPSIDRAFYASLAAANTTNADINRLAGENADNVGLAQKKHSLYEPQEVVDILRHSALRGPGALLTGVVFVTGGLVLGDGARLAIVDGALVAERTVFLGEKAELTISHTPATRVLPGLLLLDQGGLILDQRATLRAHGLVYASRSVEMGEGAVVELVGALLAGDPMLAVRSDGARITICYDQAVLGTPGLTVAPDNPIIAWTSDWRELGR